MIKTHKKLKNLEGLSISYFGRTCNSILFEKYGILDRDTEFKKKLQELADILAKQKHIYSEYYNEIIIDDLTPWLHNLTIIVDYNLQYEAGFNSNNNFKISSDKKHVESATININPTLLDNADIGPALYHELKHIYDYMIIGSEESLRENLFRDFLYKNDLEFIPYKHNFIELLDNNMSNIMNFIANCLFYVEKSECSAYLENIDQDYKDTLNNKNIIFQLMYKGYRINQIKSILRYNQMTTNYITIYTNIKQYFTELLNTINDTINNKINTEYSDTFKYIYNVNNIKSVIKIYLKRIDKLLTQSDKLFTDRYNNSLLNQMVNL